VLCSIYRSESIRTGFLLAQGGEFAFVLLSLACQLKLLPNDLNQILIITVVCSMALTPALAQAGQLLGDFVEAQEGGGSSRQVATQGGSDIAEVSGPSGDMHGYSKVCSFELAAAAVWQVCQQHPGAGVTNRGQSARLV
jgi:hypothetical protein